MHLAPFPADKGRREPQLETAMAAVRRLASLGHAARNAKGWGVRQPVQAAKVAVPAAVKGTHLSGLLDIFAAEVNVKDVKVVDSDHALVSIKGKANFRTHL